MAVLTAPGVRFGWALRVGGGNFTARIPLDEAAIRITESLGSPAQMEFTIEDRRSTVSLLHGAIVTLERLRLTGAGEAQTQWRYFGGHLLETTYTRLPGRARLIKCVAVGFESWLDWKYVPNYSSRTNVNGRVRQVHSDKAIIQELVSKYGAIVSAGTFTDATNTAMQVVAVQGVTLREALERVADVATTVSPEATRDFYVDHYARLHYYSGNEGFPAPLRIGGDTTYTTRLRAHYGANLVEAWSLSEAAGATCYGLRGLITGTLAGTFSRNRNTTGIYNEPEHASTLFNGTDAEMTATSASLQPGDTFTLEIWFKRTGSGDETFFITQNGSYFLGIDSNNKIWAFLLGTGTHFVSDDAYTDANWHHLVWTRSPGNSNFYIDGAEITGTTTARTFTSAGTTFRVGSGAGGGDYFAGYLQYPAVYSAKLTAGQVLNNYIAGVSLVPDDLEYSTTSADRVHRVYVKGANEQGSGWVQPAGDNFAGYNVDASFDEQDSTGVAKRNAYGRAFIRQHQRIESLRFSYTHAFSGWALGQLIPIVDPVLGLDTSMEIRELNTDLNLGNGQITYEMVLGDPRPATFHRGRRRRRRS